MTVMEKWDPAWWAAVQRTLDPALERTLSASRVHELSEEEEDALLEAEDGPFDPDIDLITDYLSVRMAPEQLEAVKQRLATDEAFREKVAPLIWLWNSPLTFTPP